MKLGVVIAAAGSGRRMGAEGNKVLLPIHGKPMLQYSIECFDAMEDVTNVVVVTREVDLEPVQDLIKRLEPVKPVQVVPGGSGKATERVSGAQGPAGGYGMGDHP